MSTCPCDLHTLRFGQYRWCYKCGSLKLLTPQRPRSVLAEQCPHLIGDVSTAGNLQWCENCGAIRSTKPKTYWLKPGGDYAKNPGHLKPIPPKRKKPEDEESDF